MANIRIKCPTCGARLTIIDSPANQGKSVRCPICNQIHPFSKFQIVSPVADDENDKTQIGMGRSPEDATVLPKGECQTEQGYLVDPNKIEYPLKEGMNLIGRKTYKSPSVADIAIETCDRGFSRKHLYIEVSKGHDGKLRFLAYNAENKNPTSINGVLLDGGDKVLLHSGDIISSSETSLVFKTR